MRRQFRGACYEIHVVNPDGVEKGVHSITCDGKPVDGQVIPFAEGKHRVEVVMG